MKTEVAEEVLQEGTTKDEVKEEEEPQWQEIVLNDGYKDVIDDPEPTDVISKNQWLKRQSLYDIDKERKRQLETRNRRTGGMRRSRARAPTLSTAQAQRHERWTKLPAACAAKG